jgi:hypothetical protein
VNDIAVKADGTLYAVTKTDLYEVDPSSCSATHVHSITSSASNGYNCMAFLTDGTLLAATAQGDVTQIDPSTGAPSQVGTFGSNLACSGDIVAVNNGTNDVIFATAKPLSGTSSNGDKLVTLDPNNSYHATVIGSVGYSGVYGLGFWGGKLYGFDKNGHVLEIDPGTGAGTVLNTTSPALTFYGAGTTPRAPIFNR